MPYYVQITSEKNKEITVGCGEDKIAGRLANVSKNAGPNFSYVYAFELNIAQPHNEHGAGNISSAPALHTVSLTLPDYEPIAAMVLPVMQQQDKITKLIFNQTSNQQNGQLLGQYEMSNGMIIDYKHIIDDQRLPDAQKQRGHINLVLKFEQITYSDHITNKQGVINTTSS